MVRARRLSLVLWIIVAVLSVGAGLSYGQDHSGVLDLVAACTTGTERWFLDSFREERLAAQWVVEGSGTIEAVDDNLVVKAIDNETTIWFVERIEGDVLIEFTARIDPPVAAANLNAFVHATDHFGGPLFEKERSGAYAEYHEFPMYIFTLTGEQEERTNAPGWARLR